MPVGADIGVHVKVVEQHEIRGLPLNSRNFQQLAWLSAGVTPATASRDRDSGFNAHGQQASATDPAGKVTSFAYDPYGNQVKETDADGNVTASLYDPNGHLVSTTLQGYTGDPNNPSTPADLVVQSRAYDPAGRLAQVTDSMGRTTKYGYWDDNLLDSVQVGYGTPTASTTVFYYDSAGNPLRECDGWTPDSSCGLRIPGAASKSKVAKVLPAGRPDWSRWRWMRRDARSAISISRSEARRLAAVQPSRSAVSVSRFQLRLMLGRRRAFSNVGSTAAA